MDFTASTTRLCQLESIAGRMNLLDEMTHYSFNNRDAVIDENVWHLLKTSIQQSLDREPNHDYIAGIFKLVSNLLASSSRNQELCCSSGLYAHALGCILNIENPNVITMAAQLLSNLVTSNVDTQAIVWPDIMSSCILPIILMGFKSKNSGLILIYNCVCTSTDLVCQTIFCDSGLQAIRLIFADLQNGYNFDISYSILSKLIQHDVIIQISDSIERSPEASVVLLKVLDGINHTRENSSPQPIPAHAYKDTSAYCMKFLGDTSDNLDSACDDYSTQCTILILLLEFFKYLTQFNDHSMKLALLDAGLIKLLLGCLEKLNIVQPTICNKLKDGDSNIEKHPLYGAKCDVIIILSSLSFECRVAQDSIRDLGGLAQILNHCNIDDFNPCRYL